MSDDWQVAEGTGWIQISGFGRINPRRDNVGGGRQYFTAQLDNDEYATAIGSTITEGPETYHFEFDEPFLIASGSGQHCLEMTISLLAGGRYAIKWTPGTWPSDGNGPW
jgi:hypothetical protein